MQMKLSPEGFAFIKSFEGLARVGNDDMVYPYHDALGYPTQGYGRLLSKDKTTPLSHWPAITKDEAVLWLDEDASKVATKITALVTSPLDQAQFDAVVSLAFNIGLHNFETSTLLRKLNAHDYLGASTEFLRWNRGGGQPIMGLTRRRAAERDLFLRG